MKKLLINLGLAAAVIVGTTGCTQKTNSPVYSYKANHTNQLNDTVDMITQELVSTLRLSKKDVGTIAVTSFVQLDKLNKTTHFGRVLGESFFNELHSNGLNVMDFRGQQGLSVNASGEFFITRDVKRLNSPIENKYVLVGTYAQVEEGVLINARIMDNNNGKIIASSRVVYRSMNCNLFENCKKTAPIRTIKILTDHCSKVECPTNCPTGICK